MQASSELKQTNKESIAVLGAGSWGTAVALHLVRQGYPVRLWGRDPQHIKSMVETRCNACYLPDIILPDTLQIFDDLSTVLDDISRIVIMVPSHGFCELLREIKPYISSDVHILWGTKGFSSRANLTGGSLFLHDSVSTVLGKMATRSVLSGPSFALEVARALPTAVVVASEHQNVAAQWAHCFHAPTFRVYQSDDMLGVQLGGALKNIIAVAVSASAGLKMGSNAGSALITRGLAEIMRLGQVLGANPMTLTGLAGLGDLVLTCTSNQSRNYRFGFSLGQGMSIDDIKNSSGQVIESINSVGIVCQLAKQRNVDMPITEQVRRVILEGLDVKTALQNLLSRKPTVEFL